MLPKPYTLPNGKTVTERLLIFGDTGAGKTHQLFNIAKWHAELGSDAMFYALNTDRSFDAVSTNPEFAELKNVEWTDVEFFHEYKSAAKKYHELLRPQDWLCCDLMKHGWDAAQDEYSKALAKEKGVDFDDVGDLWLEGGTNKYPIKGWDWGYPNGRYRSLANNYMLRGEGHRLIITGAKQLLKESKSGDTSEDEEVLNTYGHVGAKPDGQKDDMWRYHSTIFVQSRGPRKQKMITGKEEWGYRRYLGKELQNGSYRGEPIEDFFVDYLVKVAGWEM